MQMPRRALLVALFAALVLACSSGNTPAPPSPIPASPTEALATLTPTPSLERQVVRRDIQASRLVIPSLGIDSNVQLSRTVPYTYTPPPGCPAKPQDTETLTVPDQGIATPAESLEGLENKAWIFGHSRWQGRPGVLFSLGDINVGAELFLDGVDRATGERLVQQRFVVDAIYLTDVDSGSELINAGSPADIPAEPIVVLQTSVRQDGAGSQWILSQQRLLSTAVNLVAGDINDPCKYLLLFVFARPG
jgi:hypothetical protein